MFYTYILRCEDNSLYTGITTNVERRFVEHLFDEKKGAKYTKSHRPKKVEVFWESEDKKKASKLEFHLKKLTKIQKEKIIINNDFSVFGERINPKDYKRLI
ncbi:MAG: GIY-YIG nuclease family protein [Clostridia bacterium]|nr:GIY-YIG nuclease family protein [Clostridia bacterium]